jgi:hypothetical protein
MSLIDEEGNLLGRINIIDALVVLLVVAVLVSGIAFAASAVTKQDEKQSPGTGIKYATIDLGRQPTYVADMISEGDTTANNALNVTDVYVGPSKKPGASVVVRVAIRGQSQTSDIQNGEVFTFAGTQYRKGNKIVIKTSEYRTKGQVLAIDTNDSSLDTKVLPVRLKASVPSVVARAIEPGDTYHISDQTVATVRNVTVLPNQGNHTVLLGATVQTVNRSGSTLFGEFNVKLGSTIPFHTDNYTTSATVVRKGSLSPPGKPVNAVATVKLRNISSAIADDIEKGVVERRGNTTVVKVLKKRVEPAAVILTSDNGNIYQRAHPQNKDVYLTVQLRASRTDTGLRFRGNSLQVGENVTFDFGTIPINGTVININATS